MGAPWDRMVPYGCPMGSSWAPHGRPMGPHGDPWAPPGAPHGLTGRKPLIFLIKVFPGLKPRTLIFLWFFKGQAQFGYPFSGQMCQNYCTYCNYSIFERLGVLVRIPRIPRKRNMPCKTDPGFPTPGGRMTVIN